MMLVSFESACGVLFSVDDEYFGLDSRLISSNSNDHETINFTLILCGVGTNGL
jgi:hypothetical protein